MTAKPNPECPVYAYDDCPCRKREIECPFDMRPITETEARRFADLAKRFGWVSR